MRVRGVQGGGVAELSGQSPPEGGGGQFVGQGPLCGRLADQTCQVGAAGGRGGEVVSQLRPVTVVAQSWVDGVDELGELTHSGDAGGENLVGAAPQGALDAAGQVG